jgi:hypothetical protein
MVLLLPRIEELLPALTVLLFPVILVPSALELKLVAERSLTVLFEPKILLLVASITVLPLPMALIPSD